MSVRVIFRLVEALEDLPGLVISPLITQPSRRFRQEDQRDEEHQPNKREQDKLQTPLIRRIHVVESKSHEGREYIGIHDGDGVIADQHSSDVGRRDFTHVDRAVRDDDSRANPAKKTGHDEHGDMNTPRLESARYDSENRR